MAEIFTPFLAAFILAYILRPVAIRLEGFRIPLPLAATIAIIFGISLVAGLLALLGNLLRHEIPLIKTKLPIWIQNTQAWLEPKLTEYHIAFNWGALREQITQKVSTHLSTNADAIMSSTLDTVLLSGSSVAHGFVNIVLILFVLFYLLIDWSHFFKLLEGLIPPRFQNTARHLCLHTDGLLSQYLRGQILVISIMATFYSISLSLVGMDGAIALGVFTGLMIIIPYIGITLGLTIGVLSALLQFGLGSELIWVLVVFGIGQFLEGFFLTPRLVGERIGLHPVAVLFALIIFGKLFGFFGVLLALPASAVSLVLIQFSWSLYLKSSWYQRE
ncbi:MAG: AI-2E family transporter [Polynucleobacter sp.]|jgi:predicted PurR-regulated permease PerM|nr:AI-2E family transporter [Polynucleobacter sp.]MDZ4055767.1 AI-2E family transporter [Polynucleobacter sp.]